MDADTVKKTVRTIIAIVAMATIALTFVACSEFEQRDKRFYYRAAHAPTILR